MNCCIKCRDALEVQLLRSFWSLALESDLHAIQFRKTCDSSQLLLELGQALDSVMEVVW